MEQERIYINRRRPYVTYALIGLNLAMFAVELLMQALGHTYSETILRLGAKQNLLITCGEYWRLLTACFLHSGIVHIASNLIALYFWGPQVELLLGRVKYLIVYLSAGLFGSVLSYALSDAASVGASGAIFGLLGALLYFRTRHKQVFNQVFGMQVLVIIGINLANGFLDTGIDNFGHIGGLVGGFCAAWCTGLFREKLRIRQIFGLIGLIAVFAGIFLYGMWKYSAQYGIPMFSFIKISY